MIKTTEAHHQKVVVYAALWQDNVGVGESLCCVFISSIFPQSISNLMHCTLHLILNQLPFNRRKLESIFDLWLEWKAFKRDICKKLIMNVVRFPHSIYQTPCYCFVSLQRRQSFYRSELLFQICRLQTSGGGQNFSPKLKIQFRKALSLSKNSRVNFSFASDASELALKLIPAYE
jgi:hypothetical protein